MNLDFKQIWSNDEQKSYRTQRSLIKWNNSIYWCEENSNGARIWRQAPSGVIKKDHEFGNTEDIVHAFYIDSNNKFYACTGRSDGKLYERQNGSWIEIVDSTETAINSIVEFEGVLLLGCMGTIRSWDGTTLKLEYTSGGQEVNALALYQGVLYAAVTNTQAGVSQGEVLRSLNAGAWAVDDTHSGTAGNKEVTDLVHYDGNLLALTNTNVNPSQIYRITDTTASSWSLWFDFQSVFGSYSDTPQAGLQVGNILYIATETEPADGVYQWVTFDGSSWRTIEIPGVATTNGAFNFYYDAELGNLWTQIDGEGVYSFDISCSQLLGIPLGNPFSFTLGDCSLVPANNCDAEVGCFERCVMEGDILELQVKYLGADTLFLKMFDLNGFELFEQQFDSLGNDLYAIEKNENFFKSNLDIVINSVPNQDTIGLSNIDDRMAQTFTPTLTGANFLSIDILYGTPTGSPDYSITCTITATLAGLPDGPALASTTFTPTPLVTNTIQFDNIPLDIGVVYALVFQANDDGSSPPAPANAYRVRSVSPGSYAGGTYAFFTGGSWSAIGQDLTITITQTKELQKFHMAIAACASTGSPATCDVLAYSEALKLLDNCDCSVLISYSNDTDFAGIDYDNGQIFQTRIEAQFWIPEYEQDRSIYIDSAGNHIPLRQVVEKSLMLNTGYLPPYMHEKLALIFAHSFIEIDGKEYVTEDQYTFQFNDKLYMLSKGEVKLKEKRYYQENIL